MGFLSDASGLWPVFGCTLEAALEEANAYTGTTHIQIPENIGPLLLPEGGFTVVGDVRIVGLNPTGMLDAQITGNLILRGVTADIQDVTLTSTRSTPVPCIDVTDGSALYLQGVLLGRCLSTGDGGALRIGPNSSVDLFESAVADSEARRGGAILNRGFLRIERSILDHNSALDAGGTIYNDAGADLYLANSTVVNSGSAGQPGALVNLGSAELSNASIAFNQTAGISGALGAPTRMRNSILAENVGSDCVGLLESEGHNLIGILGTGFGPVCFPVLRESDQIRPDDPGIESWPDSSRDRNGYRDLLSVRLTSGSPAIRAGNPVEPGSSPTACEWDDFNGFNRRVAAFDRRTGAKCDVGAYQIP